ncbi:MAG: damage-control phosphatase ARMT1 family protein [Promethearchaeota archaeon]
MTLFKFYDIFDYIKSEETLVFVRMYLQAECLGCLVNQIAKSLHLHRPSLSNDDIVNIQKRIMVKMIALPHPTAMPFYGKLVYQSISQELGIPDPYRDLKVHYNQLVQSFEPVIEELISQSPDPLHSAIKLMILGNTIDFGTPHRIDLKEDLQNFANIPLVIDDFEVFQEDLANAQNIFIIGDNCGEAVFDKEFIEFIQKGYPEKLITYGVRGGPSINDMTLEEAEEIGLTDLCPVVEGSSSPGVIMDEVSPAFREAFKNADLILSKGQGNFESLDDVPSNGVPIYFMLKAKCHVVANLFHVEVGSLVFYRRKSVQDFKF